MREFFQLHAELYRSISHPKRLEILSLLRRGERAVGEMAKTMGLTASNVSQQLSVLRHAGLVERRQAGSAAFYRIGNDKFLKAYDLMTEVLEEQLKREYRALGQHRNG